jgi:hypothetical protein
MVGSTYREVPKAQERSGGTEAKGAAIRPEVGEFALWTRTCQAQEGRHTGGNADIAAAKAIEAKIVGDFARYGVQ